MGASAEGDARQREPLGRHLHAEAVGHAAIAEPRGQPGGELPAVGRGPDHHQPGPQRCHRPGKHLQQRLGRRGLQRCRFEQVHPLAGFQIGLQGLHGRGSRRRRYREHELDVPVHRLGRLAGVAQQLEGDLLQPPQGALGDHEHHRLVVGPDPRSV